MRDEERQRRIEAEARAEHNALLVVMASMAAQFRHLPPASPAAVCLRVTTDGVLLVEIECIYKGQKHGSRGMIPFDTAQKNPALSVTALCEAVLKTLNGKMYEPTQPAAPEPPNPGPQPTTRTNCNSPERHEEP